MKLAIAGALGAISVLLLWWARVKRRDRWRHVVADVAYDEVHYVDTSDGWRLALYRYRPAAEIAAETPILLCHGLGLNHRIFDLGRGRSLARWLRARGRDVWLVDLRTTHTARYTGQARPRGVAIEELVDRDARAALDRVVGLTGAASVDWLGFQLGGTVGAAVAGGRLGGRIRSLALFAAPFDLRVAPGLAVVRSTTRWLQRHGVIRLRAWCRRLAGTRLGARRLRDAMRSRSNLQADLAGALAYVAVEDIDAELLVSATVWAAADGAPRSTRGVDYRARASATARPLWLVAGTGDAIAPPASVAALAAAWGGDVTLRVVGANACEIAGRHDLASVEAVETATRWGHLDLIAGARAPDMVWYPVLAFLERLDDGALAAETWGT